MAAIASVSGSARNDGTCHQHFIRRRIQATDVGVSALTGVGGVKIGRLPARAYVTLVDVQVVTAFNAGTSDSLLIGTTQGGADILASTSIHATGFTHATSAAGLGLAVTGTSDVDVWVKNTVVGALPSLGDATIIIAYAADNDG